MIKKLKGQGAIEYLLILGAVLVIAAIVTMLVLNFSQQGAGQLYASCKEAIDKAKAYKSTNFLSDKDVDPVKYYCKPCYDYDTALINQGKKGSTCSAIDWKDIETNSLSLSGSNINIGTTGKTIDNICYQYFYKCLTVAPA